MPSTPANARRTKQPAHEGRTALMRQVSIYIKIAYKLHATGEVTIDWPFVKEEGSDALKLVMRGRAVRTDSKLVAVRVSRSEFRF